MVERWKQAGLILLGALAIWSASQVYLVVSKELVKSITNFIELYIGLGVLCLVLYLAAVKFIERRWPAELSLAGASRELGAGALWGLALFSLVMALLWAPGVYQLQGWDGSNALGLAGMVVFWLFIAIEEEILWRGLVYRLCAKVFGTWGALLLSGVLFSVKHILDNPNVTFAAFVGLLLAGVFLGAAYAATGRLWLPIGLHFGWNFAEGTLFGTEVSGQSVGQTLLTGKLTGPALWSGGKFGAEASGVAWIILIAASAFLVWRISKSKRAEPPIWRDSPETPHQVSSAGRWKTGDEHFRA